MEILIDFMKNAVKDSKDVCQIPSVELNTMICKFLINVCQRNDSEYELSTVRGVICSFDRYLRSIIYGTSIKKGGYL